MLLLKRRLRMCSTLAKEWTQKEDAIRVKIKDDRGDQILWMMMKGNSRMMTDPHCPGEQIQIKARRLKTHTYWGMSPPSPYAIVPFITWAQNAHVSLFPILVVPSLSLPHADEVCAHPSLPCHPNALRSIMMTLDTENTKQPPVPGHVSARHPVPAPNGSPARHLTMGVLYSQRLAHKPTQWLLQKRHLESLRVAEARLWPVSGQLIFSWEPSSHSSKSPWPYTAG